MTNISTLIFDLFGTLARVDHRGFLRDLARCHGKGIPDIQRYDLRKLITTNFSDADTEDKAWCRVVGIEEPNSLEKTRTREIIAKYQKLIELLPGAQLVLKFYKRRGYKLGLLSNVAKVFSAPLADLGIESLFDQIGYSCITGKAKPDHDAYAGLCNGLGVKLEECLFVGDSITNDLETPRSLGMKAVLIAPSHREGTATIKSIRDLCWLPIERLNEMDEKSASSMDSVNLGVVSVPVSEIKLLSDSEQGRYNFVGKTDDSNDDLNKALFVKRYLLPESIFAEELGYQMLNLLGANRIRAWSNLEEEPFLVIEKAPGHLWQENDLNERTALLIGERFTFSYLMSNADLRPQNTFVSRKESETEVSLIDLEHCFFDRALDLTGIDDPLSAQALNPLSELLKKRTKKRVLTAAATRRAIRRFIPIEDLHHPLVESFYAGIESAYNKAKDAYSDVQALLFNRINRRPDVIIGTQSYRRAFCKIDVEDILLRIHEDPRTAFLRCFTGKEIG